MKEYIVENGEVKLVDAEKPLAGDGQVLVQVKATGVNRADVFYVDGKYPVFGLEVAGVAEDDRRVCGIVDGGAYAEFAVLDEGCLLEIPDDMSFEQAAAVAEGLFTAYYNLAELCNLQKGEKVLVHGGAGAVGVVAIQLAKLLGAQIYATAGKPEKLELIERLGAEAVDYESKDFGKDQFDVIMDIVGADYFDANLRALKRGGRMAIISFISGAKGEVNLAPILTKDLSVFGSTIRGLDLEAKTLVRDKIKPYLKQVSPVIDKVFDFSEAAETIDYVREYKNLGKVVISHRQKCL